MDVPVSRCLSSWMSLSLVAPGKHLTAGPRQISLSAKSLAA